MRGESLSQPRRSAAQRADDQVTEWIAREKRWGDSLKRYRDAFGVEYDYALKFAQLPEKKRKELESQGKQPVVSLDLDDIVRYSSATIGATAVYFDIKLRGPGKSEQETEAMRGVVSIAREAFHDKIHDVSLGYLRTRRRVIKLGQAARVGAARWDVMPGGLYGNEPVASVMDPRHVTWDSERFASPLEFGCEEVWVKLPRVSLAWAKNNPDFKKSFRDALVADDGESEIPRSSDPSVDPPPASRNEEDGLCTLMEGWIKRAPGALPELGTETLPPDQWYMACATCGYSEADLVGTDGYDGSLLPESQPCPQCGQTPEGLPASQMHRMDTEKEIGRSPSYNDGHRRVVIAPLQPGAGVGRDGPWPEGLTDYPFMWHVPDPFPLEPYGNSQTSRNMDLQSLKNRSLRIGAEQMERNQDLTIVRENAFWDAKHEPHMFNGSQDYTAYTQSTDPIETLIKQFQGSGLNPAYVAWMDRLDAELGRHRGIGQISADAAQIKGMPVGTVARIQETGDVPLDEVIKILREDEEPFISRGFELWLAYCTEAQWVDYAGPVGERAFRLFSSGDMPPWRLKVTAMPSLDAVDVDKINAMKSLMGASPAVIQFALRDKNIPKEVIDGLIQSSQPPTPGGGAIGGLPVAPPDPAMAGAGG